ncbi:MAG: DUF4349 domain-containing protein [Chlorobi bacterium]|nr:DUF4349 domain-containing protein [Chlorobiota bacterium]
MGKIPIFKEKSMRLVRLIWWIPLFWACQGPQAPPSAKEIPRTVSTSAVAEHTDGESLQKTVKEGHVRFETRRPDSTARLIREAVMRHEGEITAENRRVIRISRNEKEIDYVMEVKIPARRLEDFMTDLDAVAGEYEFKEFLTLDVTDRYIDLEARLKNKKALRDRLSALLDRADKVDEIIRLEKELARLQAEIERLEGQLRVLKDRIARSRVHIEFFKKVPVRPRFWSRFTEAFGRGWTIFLDFLVGLARFWVFILLIGLFLIFRRKRRQKRS